ncbi:MAG TPA: DUF3536 domain-containing protein [Candidatus Limnocylindrales bacterium]|nr:DUF3536 domain-containing protein [Candidatus Limnocylindrales bacterium]
MSRGRLAVHAHFYQPLRADPFTGRVPAEPSAAPFHDWNARVEAESYRPNAERGTLRRISYDVGPTLAAWLEASAPATYAGFVAGDRGSESVRGNAMAQAFHHAILPLASAADRRTEIRWGIRDFRHRFGRAPVGLWLPETAVDLPTLRLLADEGIRHTILAPWQAAEAHVETRRPYRVELGGGRSIAVAFYDAGLSGAASFEPSATADADRFARERVATRLAGTPFPDGESGLVVIATDGELYGHHQPFRELFLQRLVAPGPDVPDRGFDVVELAAALDEPAGQPFRTVRIVERTSWSCHHGIARWSAECPDATDGRWKAPLRAALERLAGSIDALIERRLATLPGAPDPWATRDAYVEVVLGVEEPEAFAARCLGDGRTEADTRALLDHLEAQRWRLAMFASDGWYWDDPTRPETRQVLRAAARAVRLVDALEGSHLERRLLADLGLLVSPAHGIDGGAIYRQALSEVGQPQPGT